MIAPPGRGRIVRLPCYTAAMDLTFYKLRLCDSDIILVDDLSGDGRDRDWETAAAALLHRRRGAGADRLAVIAKPEGELWLRVFLADGEASPCADAALCAARYILDSGRSGAESVPMRISGGELRVDVLDSASLGISLGPPRCLPDDRALDAAQAASRATSIEAAGERFQVVPLRTGLPPADAAAVFADGGAARARARIASSRRDASKRGAATGQGQRDSAPVVVTVRVASRGELLISAPSGGALDCCASAAAALAASAAVGYSECEAMVRLGSGVLWAEWAAAGSLYVAARPEYVYRGEFHLA
jgi:diaminopimelate epimerase